ncbi:MAG: hypothetical protein CV089_02265 [Nitrospira sp. WS110]|nr:hypothetical protein [Nitrospira sp. WS110]
MKRLVGGRREYNQRYYRRHRALIRQRSHRRYWMNRKAILNGYRTLGLLQRAHRNGLKRIQYAKHRKAEQTRSRNRWRMKHWGHV